MNGWSTVQDFPPSWYHSDAAAVNNGFLVVDVEREGWKGQMSSGAAGK